MYIGLFYVKDHGRQVSQERRLTLHEPMSKDGTKRCNRVSVSIKPYYFLLFDVNEQQKKRIDVS